MLHREDIQRAEAEHDPHRAGRGELHRPAAPPLLHQRGRVHITAGWVQLFLLVLQTIIIVSLM